MSDEDQKSSQWLSASSLWKGGLFLAVVGVAAFLYFQYGTYLNLVTLAEKESQLRQFQSSNPVLVFGIAFLVYVVVTGLSLPGAAPLTLLFGWYFGFVRAFILVSFASTAGATVAFLMSRYFFKETVQSKFAKSLKSFNESWEKDGAFFLFTLRLIPAVPFFVLNAIMGLTPIKTWNYWWVSQLGMVPGTAVYVYAGSSVPDLQRLADEGVNAVFAPSQMIQIISAFVLLGLLPVTTRFLIKKWKGSDKLPKSDQT